MKRKFFSLAGFVTALLAVHSFSFGADSVVVPSEEVTEEQVQAQSQIQAKVEVDPQNDTEASAETSAPVPSATESTVSSGEIQYIEMEPRLKLGGSVYGTWWDGFTRGQNSMNINQTWFSASRELDTEKYGRDWGFCVDAVFGTEIAQCADDHFDGKWGVSGDGYGASVYQAYVEAGYENISMKIGKFETPLGYESFNGVNRLFNSTSYMYDSEPYTHCGALVTWDISERFSLNGGATMGSDNSFEAKDNYGFLFGAEYQITDQIGISYEGMFNRVNDEIYVKNNNYYHTISLSWDLTSRLNYTLVTSYGSMRDVNGDFTTDDEFGVANYLGFQLTDKIMLGARFEYLKATDTPDSPTEVGAEYKEMAFAVKYDINEHIMVRPEIRYDWVNEVGKTGFKDDGFSGGIGAALKF